MIEKMRTKEKILEDAKKEALGENYSLVEVLIDKRDLLEEIRRELEEMNRLKRIQQK